MSIFNSQTAAAFGRLGHQIIGQIAEDNLSENAAKNVHKFTQGKSLAQMSTWADEIRSKPKWRYTAPWHYISIADHENWSTVKRMPNGDILSSLAHFEKVLSDPHTTPTKKWQALAFYVHFIGDIHQPLHVGYRHDQGGNRVKLTWFGKDSNLHSVWDSKLLAHQQLNLAEYTRLLANITPEQKRAWTGKNYYQWADESKVLRTNAYLLAINPAAELELGADYEATNLPLIELRLQQAGIRLAERLNLIFIQ
ncbi:S1/P1 nuclease [Shewanella sp. OMA3-2]|uniref:S1/P1 nuclease n=1 Tax=Shewanella sp. OMA3-2 TaxID=2908650 RepID=UPI001F3F0478|nr:S1/P1 nuclease [Shewanella sp. OMA3-2]UJF21892.1 S1/P1 nuclease [Shewanella sp. OMA3-2]